MHETAGQAARPVINQATAEGNRVLALSGEVDADNVHLVRQALRVDGTRVSRTLLDLRELDYTDASAINDLAAAQRDAASADAWIRLASLRAAVQHGRSLPPHASSSPLLPDARQRRPAPGQWSGSRRRSSRVRGTRRQTANEHRIISSEVSCDVRGSGAFMPAALPEVIAP